MLQRVMRLDRTQALMAAQSCAAILVGYGCALRFDWSASTVATTVIVLQTAALGSTLSKAMLRMAGTLAGAVIGLILVACFAHDRELFILAMALLTGSCAWAMQNSSHGYAWMLVVLTGAVVGWPAATNPLDAFATSVDRVTAVTVGVFLSTLCQSVFWPVTANGQFERSMRSLVQACRDTLQLVGEGLREQSMDTESIAQARSKLLSLSNSVATSLVAARVESQRLDKYRFPYEQLRDELVDFFLTTIAVADASSEVSKSASADLATLERMFASIDQQCAVTIQQFNLPRDGTGRALECEDSQLNRGDDIQQYSRNSPFDDDLAKSLLSNRVDTFCKVAARVRSSLTEVEDPRNVISADTTPTAPGPALRTRLVKSALATFQVLLAALLFLTLNWPLGLQASMLLVMIFAYMNAQTPMALVARPILKSVLVALPLAAVFHFVIMPQVDNFAALAPWMALLFFPLLYTAASHHPSKSLMAKVSVLLVNSLISVSTAPASYDFVPFANTYLGISGGFCVVLLLAYLFETSSPRRGLHALLSAMLAESVDDLQKLDEQPHSTRLDPEQMNQHRKQSLSSLTKMKKLSALVDYRQDRCNGREKLASVMQTFDALTLKLTSSAPGRAHHPSMQAARDWCVDTLMATGNALAACQPVSIVPPSQTLLDDMDRPARRSSQGSSSHQETDADARGLATSSQYFRSLANSILDCQRELNRVDWKRWSQDYF